MERSLNISKFNGSIVRTGSGDLTVEIHVELEIINTAENETLLELPLDMRFNDGHLMAIVMYLTMMVLSATGNIYVFCSIMRIRRKKGKFGRINMLLFNLALADLVVTLIMMPMEIAWNATVSWRTGDFACRLLSFFRVLGLYLSGFVLICICLDRYFAIMNPFAICDAENRNKKLLIVAWILSICCSLPQSYIFHVERHPIFQWYEQCVTFNSFPSPDHELAYSMFGFFIMYALPMCTILYCYICILFRMNTIAKQSQDENDLRRSSASFIHRAKTKTLKMTIITALAFFICWTPYNIISLWYWFDRASAMQLDQRIQKTLFVFACSNSCLNPLIYGWYHVGGRHGRNAENTQYQQQLVNFSNNQHHGVVVGRQYQQQRRNTQSPSALSTDKTRMKIRFTKNPCASPSTQIVALSPNPKRNYDVGGTTKTLAYVCNGCSSGRYSLHQSRGCLCCDDDCARFQAASQTCHKKMFGNKRGGDTTSISW